MIDSSILPILPKALDMFISVAKELVKLPALLLPQYQPAARDLYEICQKLLTANENLARWLNKFLYFDFRQEHARTVFMAAVADYKSMKVGPAFDQLKFSCGDIDSIYYRNIDSKLMNWFARRTKREQVQGVFTALRDADQEMVAFTYGYAIAKLDELVTQSEMYVSAGNMNAAEDVRLRFRSDLGLLTQIWEQFGQELSALVRQFAQIARVPITIQ